MTHLIYHLTRDSLTNQFILEDRYGRQNDFFDLQNTLKN